MTDIINAVKKGEYDEAMVNLAASANRFGFHREVPAIVEALRTECNKQAEIFCWTIIQLLAWKRAKHGPEGRMEACMSTAELIAVDVVPREQLPMIKKEVYPLVDKNYLHPTVFQQLAQVAFYFVDCEGLRVKHGFDENWWSMPLI